MLTDQLYQGNSIARNFSHLWKPEKCIQITQVGDYYNSITITIRLSKLVDKRNNAEFICLISLHKLKSLASDLWLTAPFWRTKLCSF